MKHIYVKSAYVLQNSAISHQELYTSLAELVPVESIRNVLEAYPFDLSGCVGVHIRSQDPNTEIILKENEYPEKGMNDIKKYRQITSFTIFEKKMKILMDEDENMCFFVASDTAESKNRLTKTFGSQKIRTLQNQEFCIDRSPICIRNALVELYLLGSTSLILGSYWSSFSEVAGYLAREPPIYAGKDF